MSRFCESRMRLQATAHYQLPSHRTRGMSSRRGGKTFTVLTWNLVQTAVQVQRLSRKSSLVCRHWPIYSVRLGCNRSIRCVYHVGAVGHRTERISASGGVVLMEDERRIATSSLLPYDKSVGEQRGTASHCRNRHERLVCSSR